MAIAVYSTVFPVAGPPRPPDGCRGRWPGKRLCPLEQRYPRPYGENREMPQAGIYQAAFSVSLKSRYSRYTPSNNQNQRKSDLKSPWPGHILVRPLLCWPTMRADHRCKHLLDLRTGPVTVDSINHHEHDDTRLVADDSPGMRGAPLYQDVARIKNRGTLLELNLERACDYDA